MNVAEFQQSLELLVERSARPQGALIPALHMLRENGVLLPDSFLPVLAKACCVDIGQIREIIEHYSVFQRLNPPTARVCFGLVCRLNGAAEVSQHLQQESHRLGDGGSVLTEPRCMGHCYAAPVVQLQDETFYRFDLTAEHAMKRKLAAQTNLLG